MKPTFSVRTLGCKVNQYESEKIAEDFLKRGFVFSKTPDADVCVVNTCAVTKEAGAKSRKILRKVSGLNSKTLVVATGCYVEGSLKEISEMPQVQVGISNPEKARLAEIVAERLKLKLRQPADFIPAQKFHTRALVKIQDGCGEFCSYCIVPFLRGRPKSRDPEDVLKEISLLVKGGVREVVLTGVNLGKYGLDLEPRHNLTTLIRKIVKISHLKRIRLSSINVENISPGLIKLFSVSGKLCAHFHIPLQSGSDEILRAMRRNYTPEQFLATAQEIIKANPDTALTTDVLVGFPGESEKQFEATVKVVREVGFRKIHVFKFSARPGAKASSYPGQLPPHIKESRAKRLIRIGEESENKFLKKFLDRKLEVIVERKKNGKLVGVSPNYLRIYFEGPDTLVGKIVNVRTNGIEENFFRGELAGIGHGF